MNYEEIIHFIEDKQISIEEKDYFYHAFAYDQNEFINMLNNGIKSPILLGKSGSGLNGNFYVSLSKKENYETPHLVKSFKHITILKNTQTSRQGLPCQHLIICFVMELVVPRQTMKLTLRLHSREIILAERFI